MPILTLTVQPTGTNNRYRLGVNLPDSLDHFHERGVPVTIIVDNQSILTHTTCGPPLAKGFDLYHRLLNQWIIDHGYNNYLFRHPTKLLFDHHTVDENITLTFITVA